MSVKRTAEGQLATDVMLSTFRANGLLLAAGDELTSAVGLTAARWQVLGALALAGQPLTVPQIARRMGLTRQSVHATVARLVAIGLLDRAANVDHRRSQLVDLTPDGRKAYDEIDQRQVVWANDLADGLPLHELDATARVLQTLCRRLEKQDRRRAEVSDDTDATSASASRNSR